MTNKPTRGQHYLPRAAYLEYFIDKAAGDGNLWVQNLNTTAGLRLGDFTKVNPKKICKENYLYESPDYPVNEIERFLERVEVEYSKILENKILKKESLLPEEKEWVSMFISTLEMRVPSAKAGFGHFLDQLIERSTHIEKQFNNGEESQELKEMKRAKNTYFAEQLAVSAEINRWHFSSFLFLHIEGHEEGTCFITCDSPVAQYDFAMANHGILGVPPFSSTLEVTVPLTPNLLLFINNRRIEGHDTIDLNFICEANNRILLQSKGRVLSSNQIDSEALWGYSWRRSQSFILAYEPRMKQEDS